MQKAVIRKPEKGRREKEADYQGSDRKSAGKGESRGVSRRKSRGWPCCLKMSGDEEEGTGSKKYQSFPVLLYFSRILPDFSSSEIRWEYC